MSSTFSFHFAILKTFKWENHYILISVPALCMRTPSHSTLHTKCGQRRMNWVGTVQTAGVHPAAAWLSTILWNFSTDLGSRCYSYLTEEDSRDTGNKEVCCPEPGKWETMWRVTLFSFVTVSKLFSVPLEPRLQSPRHSGGLCVLWDKMLEQERQTNGDGFKGGGAALPTPSVLRTQDGKDGELSQHPSSAVFLVASARKKALVCLSSSLLNLKMNVSNIL